MSRYFKIIETDADEFIAATGKDLDCLQLVIPVNGTVFVAVDECEEYELEIPFGCFEKRY